MNGYTQLSPGGLHQIAEGERLNRFLTNQPQFTTINNSPYTSSINLGSVRGHSSKQSLNLGQNKLQSPGMKGKGASLKNFPVPSKRQPIVEREMLRITVDKNSVSREDRILSMENLYFRANIPLIQKREGVQKLVKKKRTANRLVDEY